MAVEPELDLGMLVGSVVVHDHVDLFLGRQSGDSISIHWCSWYFACMSRLARMVVPGRPHHVTQRGNRREAIFFEDGDQQLYCDMLAEQLRKFNVDESFRDESFRRVSGEFSVRSFPDRYSR